MLPQQLYTLTGRLLTFGIVVLLATTVQAVPVNRFQSAFTQFALAQGGDGAAIERAAAALEAHLRDEPANPVIMAYTGAANAMRATTTILPWKKLGYAEEGLALLDKSLALLTTQHDEARPNNVTVGLMVRFTAANTFLAVPSFMNRGTRGARLLNTILSSASFAQAPSSFQRAVWLRAATLAQKEKRIDDAARASLKASAS